MDIIKYGNIANKTGDIMLEKLKINEVYNAFVSSMTLTERQKQILRLYVDGKSIYEISMEINICDRVVNTELKRIRELFNTYKRNEIQRIINLIS